MSFNPEIHHRKSIRLSGYDYSRFGAYFITIGTQNHECLFGKVIKGQMQINSLGFVVHREWIRTSLLRPSIKPDEFIVMPNHFHAILWIMPFETQEGTARRAPTEEFGRPTMGSLATIIRAFKSATTKRINEINQTPGHKLWQRNYYEHIIRNEHSLNQIRQYIIQNPTQWKP